MYTMSDVIGGRFSKQYSALLSIANRCEEKKAQEKVWRAVEMDRLHMEAHKMDMMRGFKS